MKHYLPTLALVSALTVFATVASAQSDEATIRRQINAAAASMQSMQASFVQTKTIRMLDDKLVSKGRMYYSRSDKLRWEYVSPYTYTFVLNGAKVKMSKGGRSDVVDVNGSKMFKEIARLMMNSVVGRCPDDDKDFAVSISPSQKEWIVTLTPKNKNIKQMFTSIVLRFDKQRSVVTSVLLTERNGDTTLIQLSDIKLNTAIDATLFAVD